MKAVGITITSRQLADRIPRSVPVNFEFSFCEQFVSNVEKNMKAQPVHKLFTAKGQIKTDKFPAYAVKPI